MTPLVLLAGAGVGAGVVLVVAGWLTPPAAPNPAAAARARKVLRSAVAAVAAAAVVGLVTGWPALTVAAGLGGAAAPVMIERTRRGRLYSLRRVEAVAAWIEQLRDRLSASGAFQTTVASTVRIAPEAIRPDVARLAAGLAEGSPEATEAALQRFADDVDDHSADLAVVALWMWSQRRVANLEGLLTTLAAQARNEYDKAMEIDADRSGIRKERNALTVILFVVPVLLTVVDPSYLAPFGTTRGQVVLSVVMVMYAAGLWVMARLARPVRTPRVLSAERALPR
jgi:Flp pilus assembly protein TadB